MASSGAIGTAPVASFPLAGAYLTVDGVGAASGTSTALAEGAGPSTVGVGSASGSSSASGVLAAIAVAVAVATGSATVSGVGDGPITAGVASAAGSSTASAVGTGAIVTYGALGTSPIASYPTAGGFVAFEPTGFATGTSTANGVIVALIDSVASAAGSSTAEAVGYGPATAGAGSASGSAVVEGVGYGPITIGVGSATGSASVLGVGATLVARTAIATGGATVLGVGGSAFNVVGSAYGSALVYAVAPSVPSSASATGTSTAYAYSPAVVGTASGAAIVSGASPTTYKVGVGTAIGSATVLGASLGSQKGIGFASGASTETFWSATSATFVLAGSSTAQGAGTFSTAGYTPPPPFFYSFAAGPSGTYAEPAFSGNVCACQDCTPGTVEPTPPTAFVWKPAPVTNARVCDISWAGDRIIIGRAGSLWGGDSCVYLSANYGKTWGKLPVTPDNWVSVTMSATGDLCAAYPLDTQVTYASYDYAASWASFTRPWGASQTNSAEISDDGKIAIVTANPGNLIYFSTNNGASWTSKDTGLLPWYEYYTASCLSSNGSYMFAGRSLDKMHRSTNSGGLWAVCNNSYSSQFSKVACSGDGNYVLATSTSVTGWLQVSRDAGLTWTKYGVNIGDNTDGWQCCAVSTDGRVMAVGKYGGRLDVSTDFGATWTTQNVDGLNGTYLWTDVAINYDGTVIVACAVNGPLFIGTAG